MFGFNGSLPLFDNLETQSPPAGPPSRLDIHQRKLEHDKMYINSFELDRLSQPRYDAHLAQQFAELKLLRDPSQTRINRIRTSISNTLVSIADTIRPSDATRRDIASVR